MRIKNLLKVLSPTYLVWKHSSTCTAIPVRVRFAPSPTGSLHLGGLRTALFNYLYAIKHGGSFILRIEDTDQTRVVPGAVDDLKNILSWAGIKADEGPDNGNCGPYTQSQRTHIYQQNVQYLIETGAAYRCFCSKARLNLLRKEALRTREVPRYDKRCRHLTESEIENYLLKGTPFSVRFKLEEEPLTFSDMVYGPITLNISETESDPIILKSDGYPTYHLACVVDDHLMGITHVLRGVEWQVSTPKHIMMYKAFNWTPPIFAHLPLILNKDGTKLSKREGDTHVEYFKKQGYFPEAVVNFLTTMGGGFGKQQGLQILSIEELANRFILEKVNVNSCCLDFEKLDKLNHIHLMGLLESKHHTNVLVKHIRHLVSDIFGDRLQHSILNTNNISEGSGITDNQLVKVLNWSKERINKLSDLVTPSMAFLWIPPDSKAVHHLLQSDSAAVLNDIASKLKSLSHVEFQHDTLGGLLKSYCNEKKIKYSQCMCFIRIALSGLKEGPGVLEMLILLGQESSIQRMEDAARIIMNDKDQYLAN